MKRQSLLFNAPFQVSVEEEYVTEPLAAQVLVQTMFSAISPGTESLVYRGQFPADLPVDEYIAAMPSSFTYPVKYGYALVGQVIETGSEVDPAWRGQRVFSFHTHESHFLASTAELMPLPDGISPEDAVFLPNMETAVNFIMDGRPLIGEKVLVLGQGIVGLLTTALLAFFPLASLVTLDHYPLRCKASIDLGAHASLNPGATQVSDQLGQLLPGGADLTFELTGAPEALNQAIAMTGFDGRVVVGSWYGRKQASLDLGGPFHRSRIQLISSQVDTLAPVFSGRWTRKRRFDTAWEMIRRIKPARFITQRIPIAEAARAYQLLDQQPAETIQVLLTYP